jgi:hypothetical protein
MLQKNILNVFIHKKASRINEDPGCFLYEKTTYLDTIK